MRIASCGRRVVASVLCALFLCGSAFAGNSGFPDVSAQAEYAAAVRCLSATGILVGFENGEFRPDETITRAQAAAIICRLKGVAGQAEEMHDMPFTDVPQDHWAAGYITVAEALEIISGYGNGTFGPEDTLTYAQMLSILINAWGYADMAKYSGGWPEGYLAVAREYGLIGSNVNGDAPCPRGAVAQMCYRALLVDGASWAE